MSRKDKIYCVVLNRWFIKHGNPDKCTHLIESKHGNDKCNWKMGTIFSNKNMSSTCKNWSKILPIKKENHNLPNDLFEI